MSVVPTTLQKSSYRHHFTIKEYYQLAESGIFNDKSRVELIKGEIIDMSPIGTHHSGWTMHLLNRIFLQLMPHEVYVDMQNPIRLQDDTEPEPDLTVLAPRELPYFEAHPTAKDVLLLIEVADSSLEYDRDTKIPIYAENGIPECWLFDVKKNELTIYRQPSSKGYREIYHPRLDESITLSAMPDISIDLKTLFQH
jgi:Uma2 family endonuclease